MEKSHEFVIRLGSVRDVERFVALATNRPFQVSLDDGQHEVNGKSFMEMFCLILTRPLRVRFRCTEEQFTQFQEDAKSFLI